MGQLLQIGPKCITNWGRYYKLWQLLQIVIICLEQFTKKTTTYQQCFTTYNNLLLIHGCEFEQKTGNVEMQDYL